MSFINKRQRYAPNLGATDILNINNPSGPFTYHVGDVITPGADGMAIDLPLPGLGPQSVYGRGGVASVCCRKFTWDFRAQQAGNVPTVVLQNPANGGVLVGTFGLTSQISQRSAML